MGLFLCFFRGGILSLREISAGSTFLLVRRSLHSPIWSLLCMLMCASQVLHRLYSSLLQLIRGFLSRCLVSSVVLCHCVLFVVFPIFDVSRPCTSICCIHMECCRWHWSSCLLMGSLLSSSGLSLSFHFYSPLWIRVCVQFCWIAEWCWGCSGSPQFPEMVLMFRFPSFVVSPSLLLRSPLLYIRSLWTLDVLQFIIWVTKCFCSVWIPFDPSKWGLILLLDQLIR